MMSATALVSAFLNNTAVVAMLLPAVSDWTKKLRISPSKLMIPLSYAAIFGGVCTLIGTSTNLVVSGLLLAYTKDHSLAGSGSGLSMFEITKIGLPLAAAGIVFVTFLNRFLLPERKPPLGQLSDDPREYTVEMLVEENSPLAGQTIEGAGLRHLPGMYLMEIERTLVVVVMMEWMSTLKGAMLAAGLVVATRCVGWRVARRNINWEFLLAIAASFGIGKAIEVTGLAESVAYGFIRLAGDSPWSSLLVVYAMTLLLTELLTNNTAAVLAFPIAMAAAAKLGVSATPFVIVVMVAASFGFATPLGYQTYLMVFGPGGYRFSDYLRIGVPLDILYLVVTVALVPFIWPFGLR
jgi:di/tricarboxylate transporter